MNDEKKTAVQMTEEEARQFEEFKAARQKKAEQERAKQERETYKTLVDETIERAIEKLGAVSNDIKTVKQSVIDDFKAVIAMKAEVLKIKKDGQRSDSFTNTEGNMRITLGQYVTDGYRDTVEDGIAIVKEYIESLATDENTKALTSMVLKLLSRDSKGTLKASRVMQLRRIAEETGNERFIEGVKLIEESYQPAVSKLFIRAEKKNDNGAWVSLPLGMTEA